MIFYIFLSLLVTMIWGYGFIAIRWSIESFDPIWANTLRFIIAGVAAIPFLIYKKSFWRKDNILKKSFISSFFLMGVLLFQTMGLKTTTVAKSAFITTLYALFIPLISLFVFKRKYHASFWLLIFMGLVGMALLCDLEIKSLNIGDFFTLVCAVFGAGHIIYIGRVTHSVESALEFNFLQGFFVACLSLPLAFLLKGPLDLVPLMNFELHTNAWKGLLYLGIVSSMFSFTLQLVAQRKVPDHIAGLIFLMESPFAAYFGQVVFGELLNTMNLMGAGLIILSVLLIPILGREVTAEI